MKITENFSYILGLLWADGWISKKKGNYVAMETLDADYYFPIFQKLNKKWKISYRKQPLNDKITGRIDLSDKILWEFLKVNDYDIKSYNPPTKILSIIPKQYHSCFIRGWVDGDGCFYYNYKNSLAQFSITSTYEQNWDLLKNLCREIDCKCSSKQIKREMGSYSQFKVIGFKNVQIIGNYIYNSLYNENKIGLKKKFNKFSEIVNHKKKGKEIKILDY